MNLRGDITNQPEDQQEMPVLPQPKSILTCDSIWKVQQVILYRFQSTDI